MTETKATAIIDDAVSIVESETDPPMSLEEFVDLVLEHPEYACSAAEYVVSAVEHFGQRTVTEHGEELDRWRFFDDPANDGEHAILGNTQLLNQFVEDLRQMASGSANDEKMIWFEGPTATGKSELKRCLVNGLREYSKTDAGKRFTLEWNLHGSHDNRGLTYGDEYSSSDEYWYQSPVQVNPLSVLPEQTRREILYGEQSDPSLWVPPDLDPFSEEAYDYLEETHDGDYRKIIDDEHCRVSRYTVDTGQGIGVLQSEDEGRTSHKLVGEWMSGMIKELDSRGRRNPQAMSYDGVISQGNSGMTIIEDASHHFGMIKKMLSVPEGDEVKIDRRNVLPIDTVVVIISNPDMRSELMQTADQEDDAYRAIRRRLDLYEIKYLVTPSIEAELLHRQLLGYDKVWDGDEKISKVIEVDGIELAPHALEAIAFYDVVSRVESPTGMDRVEKALVYNGETIEKDGEEIDIEYFTEQGSIPEEDGERGIPCTFTRDVVADAVSDARENEDKFIMPHDLLEEMDNALGTSPIFTGKQERWYTTRSNTVGNYIKVCQKEDVLEAMLREHTVSEDEIDEYIEHVYAWASDEETELDPDPLKMEVFEREHLGKFDKSHYNIDDGGDGISNEVEDFRRNEIIHGLSSYFMEHRDEDYEIDPEDVPISELPALQELVEENSWNDVERVFEDLEPRQWNDPLDGTETETVKEDTIENMVAMFGYSEASAKHTTEIVFDRAIDEEDAFNELEEDE